MASGVDDTKPTAGSASTANVRANFTALKDEINELHWATEDSVTAGGTVDALTADFTNDVTLAEGVTVVVKAAGANTSTTPTLNVDGTGAKTIVKNSGQALAANDISGNRHYCQFRYDATNTVWVLMNPAIDSATGAILQAKKELYPVGSVYINATNNTNPGTLLGFGTWVAFGAGRVPVGFDAGDTDFNAAEKTGGNKDVTGTSNNHTLTIAEMPLHGHPFRTGSGDAAGDNSGGFGTDNDQGLTNHPPFTGTPSNTLGRQIGGEGGGGAHSHGISLTDEALQPYITVYMWKRTA